jgi:hypothetical protein
VGERKQRTPEEAMDRAVGRVAEAAGALTGDETLEAEGRALGTPHKKTFRVVPQPDGGPCASNRKEVHEHG